MLVVLLVLSLVQTAVGGHGQYFNYKYVQIDSPNGGQIRDSILEKEWVDLLSSEVNKLTAIIPGDRLTELVTTMRESGSSVTVLHDNVQKMLDDDLSQRIKHRKKRMATTSPESDLNKFLDMNEIYRFQDSILKAPNKKATVTKIEIGRTHENRSLTVLKITADGSGKKKKSILLDGGIHAREWISPATMNIIIYDLIFNLGASSDLLQHFDWHILHVANPDGYSYSHTNQRLWRKNREPNSGSKCVGTDLNRNFGYPSHMPYRGGSVHPCSDTFSGKTSFSTKESVALKGYMDTHKDQFQMYISLHAFGRYLLYPYGYSYAVPDNADELHRVANIGKKATKRTSYVVGSSARALYIAAGGSDDYARGGAEIPYSYTLELPPSINERAQFSPAEGDISAYAGEGWRAIQAMALEVARVTSHTSAPTTMTTTTTTTTSTTTTTTTTTTTKPNNNGLTPFERFMQWYYSFIKRGK